MEVLEYMRNSVEQQHGRFTQFCGDLFRGFINVEESWEEVRCADSALLKARLYEGVKVYKSAVTSDPKVRRFYSIRAHQVGGS